MRILRFKCTGQRLKKDATCDFGGIVPGSKGYLQISVQFDADWAKLAKVAEFSKRGSEEVYPVIVRKGVCMVPDEVTDTMFYLRIIGKSGDQKIVTNKVGVN